MTKNQRRDLYYAAMFEIVAFDSPAWESLDNANNGYVLGKYVPEMGLTVGEEDALTRLSKAIDLLEKR